MSDEEMDDWLDKPMDADVHRFRKLSAASLESLPSSSDESEIKIHVIQEQPDEEEIAAQGNRRQLSSMWRETWCWETNSQNRTANNQGYEIVLPTSTADEDDSAK